MKLGESEFSCTLKSGEMDMESNDGKTKLYISARNQPEDMIFVQAEEDGVAAGHYVPLSEVVEALLPIVQSKFGK